MITALIVDRNLYGEKKMIEVLRNIFIAVLYLFGIGLFGFFAVFAWALMIRVIRESKDD